jgi:hypothetical protein
MQGAFEPVLFVVCGWGIVGAVLALVSAKEPRREYGKSRLPVEIAREIGQLATAREL